MTQATVQSSRFLLQSLGLTRDAVLSLTAEVPRLRTLPARPSQRMRNPRTRGCITKILLRVAESRPTFTVVEAARALPFHTRNQINAQLAYMSAAGKIRLVRKGSGGRKSSLAVYASITRDQPNHHGTT